MNLLKAFIVGGIICAIGQILIDKTKLTPARILTAFVVSGVILSAIGLYEPLVKFAGAGASVPLTGFGHLLAKGVREAVQEKGLLGVLSGGMTASSAGITTALIAGLIASLFFKNRIKE
ncbi:MAG TPA: stage V sporulation protein AE [Ruminococcus sp.]|jgi:stage V sporulation protein AE|nr:stage V sporulation protein AE [Ruminococcus sp.]